METEYRTVAAYGEAEFTEKRSKFIGRAKPVTAESEAIAFIQELKSKYWDATHNVYAYSLRCGNLQRYSDDGEPKGTAGVPTLDVLKGEALQDVVVVVTRYFGGVKLGPGGLVHAYSKGAKLAVEAAGMVTMKPCSVCVIHCTYSQYAIAEALLNRRGCKVNGSSFDTGVTVNFTLPTQAVPAFQQELTETFAGRVALDVVNEIFAPV